MLFRGLILMGKAKMDERGRILIPLDDRERLGLKAGVEFDVHGGRQFGSQSQFFQSLYRLMVAVVNGAKKRS